MSDIEPVGCCECGERIGGKLLLVATLATISGTSWEVLLSMRNAFGWSPNTEMTMCEFREKKRQWIEAVDRKGDF